jgi:hypothetical protein
METYGRIIREKNYTSNYWRRSGENKFPGPILRQLEKMGKFQQIQGASRL